MAFTLKLIAWMAAINVYEHASLAEKMQFWEIYISASVITIALTFLAFYLAKRNELIGTSLFVSMTIIFIIGPPLAIAFHLISPLWMVPYIIILISSVVAAVWREIVRQSGNTIIVRSILRVDSLFKWFWTHFPIAIAIAFVCGLVAAISGNANFSPYTASIGFFCYVTHCVFRLFVRKDQ
jgi:hypothetical protein